VDQLYSVPRLIQVARARTGISQTNLAKAIGCSQAFVSKVESGIRDAGPEVLQRMAAALGIPLSFFSVSEPIYAQTASFHRTRRVTKKEGDRLWSTVNMLRFAVARLLSAVDLESPEPLPSLDVDRYDPVEAARMVRAAWRMQPGPVGNLVHLVEASGVIVVGFDFGTSSISGVSLLQAGSLPPMVFLNTRHPGDRLRFTLAHELGHLVMHRVADPNTMEDEADAFAAEFLMPASDIRSHLDRRLNLSIVGSLKRVWRTSMYSIFRRAKDLGTISKDQYRRFMIQMGQFKRIEPHEIPQEPTPTVSELWDFHRNELEYSRADMFDVLPVPSDVVQLALGFVKTPALSLHEGGKKKASSVLG